MIVMSINNNNKSNNDKSSNKNTYHLLNIWDGWLVDENIFRGVESNHQIWWHNKVLPTLQKDFES